MWEVGTKFIKGKKLECGVVAVVDSDVKVNGKFGKGTKKLEHEECTWLSYTCSIEA